MERKVIYPTVGAFRQQLAVNTVREHTCGFYGPAKTTCQGAPWRIDLVSGHRVCSGCGKITVKSGLRTCDICDTQYIDLNNYQDPKYETNCPCCIERYGLDE